ncbi:phosphatase and actin regulator 3 isoform X4 [Ornithorhynchus anatinus]|uniref:phosphatase and actin regulator 3 isoform X4 n=1 Tax=Ornithorhynchus anatinus TaxID=9258 RepID=UPI0010A830D7|nr:phosphatase and actin regulator 3 isoform X4 [Ornithorhynchus anatinus]
MAESEEGTGCFLPRGRSQSDPSILTDTTAAEAGESPDEMDQSPAVRSEYLVSGIRTPPVRRNSKLATLGRIFKPWKWRKKKNEKLKQTSAVLEKKIATRQGRDELIKKGLLEMMEQAKIPSTSSEEDSSLSAAEETAQALLVSESIDSPSKQTERNPAQFPSPPLLPVPPPKTVSKINKNATGQATALFQASGQKGSDSHVRGQHSTPTGSPHLAAVHMPLPPSRVIEELHRALATKHRQDSFQGRESKGSPKKRVDVRPSRTSSIERNREKENSLSFDGESENKRNSVKESDENKENMIMDSEIKDDTILYQDEEALNDSIISGTLPRKCKKELLAVKLRNRPSKQELEDRNIFPRRTDEERQEIRQQIEMKLSKRLSQRPAVEELERRNILKQRNDQTEQEERREIKQRLTRKLNQRPTVDELRDRKILIRFSDYVEVAKAQDYDRRADKPWTRLSAADKAAIRKELNEYKSNEMEVHASSKHLTRFHRP